VVETAIPPLADNITLTETDQATVKATYLLPGDEAGQAVFRQSQIQFGPAKPVKFNVSTALDCFASWVGDYCSIQVRVLVTLGMNDSASERQDFSLTKKIR
jgi:hypothetical protein